MARNSRCPVCRTQISNPKRNLGVIHLMHQEDMQRNTISVTEIEPSAHLPISERVASPSPSPSNHSAPNNSREISRSDFATLTVAETMQVYGMAAVEALEDRKRVCEDCDVIFVLLNEMLDIWEEHESDPAIRRIGEQIVQRNVSRDLISKVLVRFERDPGRIGQCLSILFRIYKKDTTGLNSKNGWQLLLKRTVFCHPNDFLIQTRIIQMAHYLSTHIAHGDDILVQTDTLQVLVNAMKAFPNDARVAELSLQILCSLIPSHCRIVSAMLIELNALPLVVRSQRFLCQHAFTCFCACVLERSYDVSPFISVDAMHLIMKCIDFDQESLVLLGLHTLHVTLRNHKLERRFMIEGGDEFVHKMVCRPFEDPQIDAVLEQCCLKMVDFYKRNVRVFIQCVRMSNHLAVMRAFPRNIGLQRACMETLETLAKFCPETQQLLDDPQIWEVCFSVLQDFPNEAELYWHTFGALAPCIRASPLTYLNRIPAVSKALLVSESQRYSFPDAYESLCLCLLSEGCQNLDENAIEYLIQGLDFHDTALLGLQVVEMVFLQEPTKAWQFVSSGGVERLFAVHDRRRECKMMESAVSKTLTAIDKSVCAPRMEDPARVEMNLRIMELNPSDLELQIRGVGLINRLASSASNVEFIKCKHPWTILLDAMTRFPDEQPICQGVLECFHKVFRNDPAYQATLNKNRVMKTLFQCINRAPSSCLLIGYSCLMECLPFEENIELLDERGVALLLRGMSQYSSDERDVIILKLVQRVVDCRKIAPFMEAGSVLTILGMAERYRSSRWVMGQAIQSLALLGNEDEQARAFILETNAIPILLRMLIETLQNGHSRSALALPLIEDIGKCDKLLGHLEMCHDSFISDIIIDALLILSLKGAAFKHEFHWFGGKKAVGVAVEAYPELRRKSKVLLRTP